MPMPKLDPGAWGKFETQCEWCGTPWEECSGGTHCYNPDGLAGHEMLVCKTCCDELEKFEAESWHVASFLVTRKIRAGDLITYDTRTRQFKITHRPWYRRIFRWRP